MRITLDTNVLVRVVISPRGAAAELFRLIWPNHRLVTSSPQLVELLDVLSRPEIQRLHRLEKRRLRKFVSRICKFGELARLPGSVQLVVPGDSKDEPILRTAVVGRSDVLCTRDRHFSHPDVVATCARYGIRILPDDDLLAELRGS